MRALSILDIGPLTEDVPVGGGTEVRVYPITPEGLFTLITMFPDLQKFKNMKGLDAATLMTVVPSAVAMAIAVATTNREEFPTFDEWKNQLVAVAQVVHKRVVPPAQIKIINAAIRLTFPDGIGPFMQELEALTSSAKEVRSAASGQDSGTMSSKPSRSGFTSDSRGMRLGRGAPSAASVH